MTLLPADVPPREVPVILFRLLVATPLLVTEAAQEGAFAPYTQSAGTSPAHAGFASAATTFDPYRGDVRLAGTAETAVAHRVSVRVEAVTSSAHSRAWSSFGVRWQFLDGPVDGAIGSHFEPIGHEGRPAAELVAAFASRIGDSRATLNLVYGEELQEPQRHGELRAALFRPFRHRIRYGVDVRLAHDLDAGRDPADEGQDVVYDLRVGPAASMAIGRNAALLTHVAGVRTRYADPATRATRDLSGIVGIVGVGGTF